MKTILSGEQIVAISLLWSLFILPNIPSLGGLPAFRLDDILVTTFIIFFIHKKWVSQLKNDSLGIYTCIILALTMWIGFTMLVNNRLTETIDYYEFYKMYKFIMVTFAFYFLFNTSEKREAIIKHIFLIFIILLIFNFFSLLNIGAFNRIVMPFYAPEHHLQDMIYSLDDPKSSIRLLGTMGNPNINALIWGVFISVFIALHQTYAKKYSFILKVSICLSFLMFLFSQSRTALIGLLIAYGIYSSFFLRSKKLLLRIILFSAIGFITYFALSYFALSYLQTLWSIDVADHTSLLSRLAKWDYLYEMIEDSPWYGYGPNKDFFYSNNLHADNEYILMTWRYGVIGLVFYLSWLLFPLLIGVKIMQKYGLIWAKAIIIICPLTLVCAITSAPMSDPRFMLIYASICGLVFAETKRVIT